MAASEFRFKAGKNPGVYSVRRADDDFYSFAKISKEGSRWRVLSVSYKGADVPEGAFSSRKFAAEMAWASREAAVQRGTFERERDRTISLGVLNSLIRGIREGGYVDQLDVVEDGFLVHGELGGFGGREEFAFVLDRKGDLVRTIRRPI